MTKAKRRRKRVHRQSKGGRPRGSIRSAAPRNHRIGPTPELLHKRALLAQGGDPTLCDSPLGVLLARNKISEHEFDAAVTYKWLRSVKFGSPFPRQLLDRLNAARPNLLPREEGEQAKLEALYAASVNRLASEGVDVARAVDECVIFEEWATALSEKHARSVRAGLAALRSIL